MATRPPITRVVVLMLENRSFDHMLGRMTAPQVNGILGPTGNPNPNYTNQYTDKSKQVQTVLVGGQAPLDMVIPGNKRFQGPSHSFDSATSQLYSTKTPTAPQSAAPAPMSGFMGNYESELNGVTGETASIANAPMTCFTSADLPVLWQLAGEFCVCDNWFSEVPGPTEPNRLFTHAATSEGLLFNPWGDMDIDASTIYDQLDKAGQDWAFFHSDLSDSDNFPALKKRTERIFPFEAFAQQAQAGSLPTYSFLCPRYNDKPPLAPNSEHPPYNVQNGENLIADVYEAVRSSPLWNNTLLVVTYDEHGGFYDHVTPPYQGIDSPDGQSAPTQEVKDLVQSKPNYGYALKPEYQFDFGRLGCRVPALLISPWIAQGVVDSTQYQHTSIMATLRELFGVGSVTQRDAQAASFLKVANLPQARTDTPATLNRPAAPVPATAAEMQLPLTEPQTELVQMAAHLDGHPDSGKPIPPEKISTRQAAADYIDERRFAHNEFHRQRKRRSAYNVVKDPNGTYSWLFVSDEGQIIAKSATEYATKSDAEAVIAKMRDLAPFARQVG